MSQTPNISIEKTLAQRLENIRFLALWLFLIVFTIRFLFFLISDEGGGDAIARVSMARNIADHGMWLFAGVWQPLPFYLIAGALSIYNDPTFTPRFLSLLYSTLAVFPFFYLIKREFNLVTATLTIVFLAFYSTHIFFSIISYAESLVILLIILSFYYFLPYYHAPEKNKYHLIYTSLMLALASLVRLEAFILIAIMNVFIVWRGIQLKQSLKEMISSLCLLSTAPAIAIGSWFLENYLVLGDPLYFRNWSSRVFDHSHQNLFESWDIALLLLSNAAWHIWMPFWLLGPVLSLMILAGLAHALIHRKYLAMMLYPAGLIFFVMQQTLQGMATLQLRYDLIPSILLLPFGALFLSNHLDKLRPTRQLPVLVMVLCTHLIISTGVYLAAKQVSSLSIASSVWMAGFQEVRYRYVVPEEIKQLCTWLNETTSTSDKMIIDYAPFSSHIIVYAGLSDLTQLNGSVEDIISDVPALYGKSQVYSLKSHDFNRLNQEEREQILFDYISKYHPKFLIYHSEAGYLQSLLNFGLDCSTKNWRSFRFHCRYKQSAYHVYEIEAL
jgi:hypothetical protein